MFAVALFVLILEIEFDFFPKIWVWKWKLISLFFEYIVPVMVLQQK